jgi:hypothetical protein
MLRRGLVLDLSVAFGMLALEHWLRSIFHGSFTVLKRHLANDQRFKSIKRLYQPANHIFFRSWYQFRLLLLVWWVKYLFAHAILTFQNLELSWRGPWLNHKSVQGITFHQSVDETHSTRSWKSKELRRSIQLEDHQDDGAGSWLGDVDDLQRLRLLYKDCSYGANKNQRIEGERPKWRMLFIANVL